jgi:hypothetical protein
MKVVGTVVTATAVALLVAGGGVTPSDAAQNQVVVAPHKRVIVRNSRFDGLWSVSIYTQTGPCDASYRYPARIFRGQVLQADNDFSYQLAGAVNPNGAIVVTVSKGGQSATGYGRLNAFRGAGQWSAAGGACTGVWNAIRRGASI